MISLKNGKQKLLSRKNKQNKPWVSKLLDTHIYDWIDYLLLFIIIMAILLFIVWPIAMVIIKSFFPEDSFSLKLYKNLFEENMQLLFNSIFVSTLSTLLTLFISIVIALYINFSAGKSKRVVYGGLLLTMISPPFVSSLAYIMLFGRRGLITHDILGVTLNPYGWQGIVLMQTVSNTSLIALLLSGILGNIDRDIIQASRDLGAGIFETIKRAILPMAKPGLIAAFFIAFVKSLSDFGTPIIIGGRFNVLATEAYLSVIGGGDISRASAISVLILIPALAVFFVYRYYMENMQIFSGECREDGDENPYGFRLRGATKYFLGAITWFFLIFVFMQYLSIFLSAISDYSGHKIVFTTEYIRTMKYSKMTSFYRSIRYGFIAGIATSIIGILMSYYMERRNISYIKWMDFAATVPYIIPGTFFGIGYILAFNDYPLPLTGTETIVVLNCIFRQLPIATKTASASLKNINPDLENAARDLGVKNIFIMKDIIMPLMKPAFLVSFVNTFTATMTTVGAIIFIISPGAKVATVEMFNTIRDGDYGVGSVIASMIILGTLIINLSFSKIVLKKRI